MIAKLAEIETDAEFRERFAAEVREVKRAALAERLFAEEGYALPESAAVRNIAETLDRLGLLKPPPVEAPEPEGRA